MKYRKKPVVIEAFKYGVDGQPDWFCDKVTTNEITTYANGKADDPFEESSGLWCEIKTLEGTMVAREGDYIIRGIEGEVYPCKPSVFKETYEKVEEPKKRYSLREVMGEGKYKDFLKVDPSSISDDDLFE